MGRPLRTSARGIELIKSFDGFWPVATALPRGGWIIGYGHTKSAREGLRVSREEAGLILRFYDLRPVEAVIRTRVLMPLSQNEFDALVSFAWNIGIEPFLSSEVLAALNRGDRLGCVAAMALWRRGLADGEVKVIDALVRRRAAEIALFLDHVSGPAPSAGALLAPRPDSPQPGGGVIVQRAEEGATPPSRGTAAGFDAGARTAARAVGERMSRILGEAVPLAPQPVRVDAPTPEQIEDAVRVLVGEAPAGAAPAAGPPPSDAPAAGPPEGIERRRPLPVREPPSDTVEPLPPSAAPRPVIDDVTPVRVTEADIARALRENDEALGSGATGVLTWLPFAVLAGLGLVGLVAGLQLMFGDVASLGAGIYLAPVLALGGGFLFATCCYYLFRLLGARN